METEDYKKKSRPFKIVVVLVFLAVLGFSYYNFFIKNDFLVTKQVECDPTTEACFVSDCEANDSECDTETTYKKIEAPSKYAGSDYEKFTCEAGDPNCKVITCSPETVEAGEKCFQ